MRSGAPLALQPSPGPQIQCLTNALRHGPHDLGYAPPLLPPVAPEGDQADPEAHASLYLTIFGETYVRFELKLPGEAVGLLVHSGSVQPLADHPQSCDDSERLYGLTALRRALLPSAAFLQQHTCH